MKVCHYCWAIFTDVVNNLLLVSSIVNVVLFYHVTLFSAIYAVILCLCTSAPLSITNRSSTRTAKPMIIQTMPYDSPEMRMISAKF